MHSIFHTNSTLWTTIKHISIAVYGPMSSLCRVDVWSPFATTEVNRLVYEKLLTRLVKKYFELTCTFCLIKSTVCELCNEVRAAYWTT